MKSCILTIIKNEHLYLDEWIKYHLSIGISHIFIFEDIDSYSHKEIADKYPEVTLNSVDVVLDATKRQEARNLKKTKKYSSHYLYLKNILLYMNERYSEVYDWCFSVDVDEFITTEANNINDVLSLYEGYDAVVLRWKCYGANGHISKPDYSIAGVLDYFTKETSGIVRERPSCLCKTCFNIKKYKPEFFGTPHSPNNTCNYCNTDFVKSNVAPSYEKMYIRHYITKSWEEYAYKLQIRGFMWGGRRNFDFFFNVNPELRDKKEQLISELNKEILVVMPYSGKRAQGNEIELALRGWRKFCKFNYHFVVIGDFDNIDKSRFPWVEFIDCPRVPYVTGQYNPHLDIIHKFSVVAEKYKDTYDGFIYITDDEYAIKPFCLKDIQKTYYHARTFVGQENAPTSYWNHDKWKTRQLLDRDSLPHVNYTTHFPAYFEFDKLKEMCDKYDLYHESYVFDDLYFNLFEHDEPIFDFKIRLGVWNREIFDRDFQKAVEDPDIKFICNSVEGWSAELERALHELII